ncbi:hypothetical protein ACFSR7_20615 [Cohnella sp. GCM10020058]|uniref:hypothetical protein n=1 Tax=Cohnella sp. GCM10020058 TaxID=3317330 RepID=UPI003641F8D3
MIKDTWNHLFKEDIENEYIRRILAGITDKSIPIHLGCHLLSALYHKGNESIPKEFEEFYSELLDVPLPKEYTIWNQEALKNKLQKLKLYEQEVIELAKEFFETKNNSL